MSQEEMYPESQSQFQQSDGEIQAQPYYWSTTSKTNKTGNMPKNEHPSTFEQSIPPYSYRAQDAQPVEQEPMTYSARADQTGAMAQRRQEELRQQQAGQRQFSPDGDAFESGYRPFASGRQWQQVPWWARPQHNNHGVFRWLVFIILAVVFAKPILFILTHLLVGVGILLGLAAFAVLLPIFIVLVLAGVFSVMALIVLSALGVPIRPRRIWGYWRNYRRRRRTWGW